MARNARVEFVVERDSERWLQSLLELAVREGWCTNYYCGTCRSYQLSISLGMAQRDEHEHYRKRELPEVEARTIVAGLAGCRAPDDAHYEFEQAVRWGLLHIWLRFGEYAHTDLFRDLEGTWSGEVLESMRRHYAAKQERRRRHEARQGVKMRDWKD